MRTIPTYDAAAGLEARPDNLAELHRGCSGGGCRCRCRSAEQQIWLLQTLMFTFSVSLLNYISKGKVGRVTTQSPGGQLKSRSSHPVSSHFSCLSVTRGTNRTIALRNNHNAPSRAVGSLLLSLAGILSLAAPPNKRPSELGFS